MHDCFFHDFSSLFPSDVFMSAVWSNKPIQCRSLWKNVTKTLYLPFLERDPFVKFLDIPHLEYSFSKSCEIVAASVKANGEIIQFDLHEKALGQ